MMGIMDSNFSKKYAEAFKDYYFQVIIRNKPPIPAEEIINE